MNGPNAAADGAGADLVAVDKAGPPYLVMAGLDWWYDSHAHAEIQLVRQLARTRRVLFVNSIGMRLPRPGRTARPWHRILRKAKSILRLLRHPEPTLPDLHVLSPFVLPLYGSPQGRALNAALVRLQVRLVWRWLRLTTPVVVVTLPTAWDVVRPLRRRALLAYRPDKYSAHPDIDRPSITLLERALVAHSDRVLYASDVLRAAEERTAGGRGALLAHGVDSTHFARRPSSEEPADLRGLPRPRLGYFGSLDDYRVDLELLGRLADELPEATVVLIGEATCSLAALRARPNVHCLGARSYDDIPAYGSGFDVGLMPYQRNEWIRHSSPIKAREYLALGLPVVATRVPQLEELKPWLLLADDQDQFIAHVRAALAGAAPSEPAARRAAVVGRSWAVVADELVDLAEHAATGAA